MNISGSPGVANNEGNNPALSNPRTDNPVAAKVIIPEQVLSADTLPKQKRINERQIIAAVNPEYDGQNPVTLPETSTLNISEPGDNIDSDNASGGAAQTSSGFVNANFPLNSSGSGTTGSSFSNDTHPLPLAQKETKPGLTQHGKTSPDNPVKPADASTFSSRQPGGNIVPGNTFGRITSTLFGSGNVSEISTKREIFGNVIDVFTLHMPTEETHPGFTYHGKTYHDDTDVYLIYFFADSGSDSVQLTKYAIAELERADPDIFQGLPCPNLLFSRHDSKQIRMSKEERILRWQPLAELIIREGGATDIFQRDGDLTKIFTPKGIDQATNSISFCFDGYTGVHRRAVSSWRVATVPFGLFRRGFYKINPFASCSEREWAGPDYDRFAAARDDWAKSRFVSQLQMLVHSSDKSSDEIVETLKQACPLASSEAAKEGLTFNDLAGELDARLGLGMTRFEAQLVSPPDPHTRYYAILG